MARWRTERNRKDVMKKALKAPAPTHARDQADLAAFEVVLQEWHPHTAAGLIVMGADDAGGGLPMLPPGLIGVHSAYAYYGL
jgi:hypothetical protein